MLEGYEKDTPFAEFVYDFQSVVETVFVFVEVFVLLAVFVVVVEFVLLCETGVQLLKHSRLSYRTVPGWH
jgi:hypothetical protein